jgi:hypothetical protein
MNDRSLLFNELFITNGDNYGGSGSQYRLNKKLLWFQIVYLTKNLYLHHTATLISHRIPNMESCDLDLIRVKLFFFQQFDYCGVMQINF